MPILVSTTVAPPGPPLPQVPPTTPLAVTYVDPDGTVWPWWDPTSGCVVTSVTGIGSPPASYVSTALPGGGALPQHYGAVPRQIVIGLHVYDDTSQAGLLDLIDRLARALWHDRPGGPTPGRLIFARPDGSQREIEVFCTSGPEQTDADATRNAYQASTDYALTFESGLDPHFSDVDPVGPLTFAPAPDNAGVPPMPPVLLASSNTFGEVSVDVRGNAEAYPIWQITGGGTPTLTNVTTGLSFGLEALQDGETITIDTRPGRQSAIDQDGNDRWSDLVKSSPRDLWALAPGTNLLELSIETPGEGAQISMLYHPRWLRA